MRIALFASGRVGFAAARELARRGHPPVVVVGSSKELAELTDAAEAGTSVSAAEAGSPKGLATLSCLELDLGILAWWPHLLRQPLLGIPRLGYLNFHPSLLPHNRGKHYNFWTIVEGTPFGVTIHWVTEGVDDGDIAFQATIEKTWEDTGESLYEKAQNAMIRLFSESLDAILEGDIPRHAQPAGGSFHRASEIDEASRIDLDEPTTPRRLLDLMRARTFPPHPGSWFEENGRRYEIELRIRETR